MLTKEMHANDSDANDSDGSDRGHLSWPRVEDSCVSLLISAVIISDSYWKEIGLPYFLTNDSNEGSVPIWCSNVYVVFKRFRGPPWL